MGEAVDTDVLENAAMFAKPVVLLWMLWEVCSKAVAAAALGENVAIAAEQTNIAPAVE